MLDLAAEKVPHRSEPLIMSINLARATKDPKRMGDAVQRLLELGWPGDDDRIRLEARQQVESLAKTLREEGAMTRPKPSWPGSPRPRPATSSCA